MTKPDWKDAPEWANYLSMNRDGWWWWHELMPTIFENCYEWVQVEGYARACPIDDDDWRDTLERRP